jgi:GTP:adenosylcobinamide-phosphate guanylyltransferase
MRWLVGTIFVLLVSLVIYVGSAVWSVKGLVEAAQSGNGPAIIARTDLPRLKRSLVDQIVRAYLERQGAKGMSRLFVENGEASLPLVRLRGLRFVRKNAVV